MESVLVVVSAVLYCVGLAYFIFGIVWSGFRGKKWKLSPFTGMAIGAIGALLLIYFVINQGSDGGPGEQVIMAILGAIRVLTGENSVTETRAVIDVVAEEWKSLFYLYTAALHLSASSVLLGAILKVVDSIFPMLRYIFGIRGKIIVFSSITERGVLLAEDIKNRDKKKKIIVFLKQSETNDEQISFLTERIHDISGFILSYDLEKVPLPLFSGWKVIDYFLLKDNHDENINDALCIADVYEKKRRKHSKKASTKKKTRVHVLSDNPETECLLDTVHSTGECSFKLINEMKLMLYQLFDRNPLFMYAEDSLEILVIGAGRNGQEAAKICSWCGYTSKLTPKVWLIDKDIAPYNMLKKECPEMMDSGNVEFKQIDVETPEFLDFLREHPQISYVICAVGDDHLNLRTAMDVRMVSYETGECSLTERKKPFIGVLLNDEFLHEKCGELCFGIKATITEGEETKTIRKRSYDLEPYGSVKDFYTWENICESDLEANGLAVHIFYCQEEFSKENILREYEGSNYNQDSSVAAAMHAKYKLYAVLTEKKYYKGTEVLDWSQKPTQEMIDLYAKYIKENVISHEVGDEMGEYTQEIIDMCIFEHKRWNAYTRSIGWRKSTPEQRAAWKLKEVFGMDKHNGAKMHNCLVEDWYELSEKDKKSDANLIIGLADILTGRQKIEEAMRKSRWWNRLIDSFKKTC